VAVYSEFELF